jgi:hypothetical protein
MSLPKIDAPLYDLILPLSNKKIKFRPFLVKEEKILLMAMESDDEKTIISSIKQILNNCCITDIDIDDLPIIDIEYFFLNIQARSVSEISELKYRCNNIIDEKECGNVMKYDINILDITPKIPDNFSNKIELTKTVGMVLKIPSFRLIDDADENDGIDVTFKQIASCIDYIYDADTIFYAKDHSEQELIDFIENLKRDRFLKIKDFFSSIPKLEKDINFCCSKCGYTEKIHIEGLHNFFV